MKKDLSTNGDLPLYHEQASSLDMYIAEPRMAVLLANAMVTFRERMYCHKCKLKSKRGYVCIHNVMHNIMVHIRIL